MISERFIVPALVAAAVHAALFAFFPATAPGGGPVQPDPATPAEPWPPMIDFFDPPVVDLPAGASEGGGGQPVPQLPEVIARLTPMDFAITTPRVAPTIDVETTNRVPLDGPGLLRGPRGFGAPGEVFAHGLLDREPRARVRMPPEYPHEMKRQGLEGEVEVGFVVAPDGSVRDAYVVRSNRRELEVAAVRAVLRWKFEPGQYRGRAVSFRMSVPIVFRLEPGT